MIFGAQFYPLLNKMTNWRQSLFALVLATRQYPNFKLWTEVEERQGATEFLHVLQECWEFHFDKFNHIDLGEVFDVVAPFIPENVDQEDLENEGARFAFDAAICLNAAIEAIVMPSEDAESASKASMASVIRLCEHRYAEEDLDEDALLEKIEILAEIDFQAELMEKLQQPRSPELIKELLEYALSFESSSIGLDAELSIDDLYRPQVWEEKRQKDADPYAHAAGTQGSLKDAAHQETAQADYEQAPTNKVHASKAYSSNARSNKSRRISQNTGASHTHGSSNQKANGSHRTTNNKSSSSKSHSKEAKRPSSKELAHSPRVWNATKKEGTQLNRIKA